MPHAKVLASKFGLTNTGRPATRRPSSTRWRSAWLLPVWTLIFDSCLAMVGCMTQLCVDERVQVRHRRNRAGIDGAVGDAQQTAVGLGRGVGQPSLVDGFGDLIGQCRADLVGDSGVGVLAQFGRNEMDTSRLRRGYQ